MKNYKAIWLYLIFSPFLLVSCREIDSDQEESGMIVFSSARGGNFDSYVMDSEKGESDINQITTANIGATFEARQSPFGGSEAYAVCMQATDQQIAVYSIESGDNWVMVDNGGVPINFFTVAENFTNVVFHANTEYYIARFSDNSSSGTVLLTASPTAVGADFSPDGEKIAFVDLYSGVDEISVIKTDGSGYTNLTDSGGLYFSRYPAWSPLGDRIAYICERTDGVTGDLFIMNSDGSEQHYIAGDAGVAETMPKWSPDGTRVAYLSGPGTDREIFIVNPDIPGSEKQVSSGSGVTIGVLDFNWSPFGTKLVFSADWEDATGEIYTVNDDGSSQTRLTFDASADLVPGWIR